MNFDAKKMNFDDIDWQDGGGCYPPESEWSMVLAGIEPGCMHCGLIATQECNVCNSGYCWRCVQHTCLHCLAPTVPPPPASLQSFSTAEENTDEERTSVEDEARRLCDMFTPAELAELKRLLPGDTPIHGETRLRADGRQETCHVEVTWKLPTPRRSPRFANV